MIFAAVMPCASSKFARTIASGTSALTIISAMRPSWILMIIVKPVRSFRIRSKARKNELELADSDGAGR